jgi:hypothetical protein
MLDEERERSRILNRQGKLSGEVVNRQDLIVLPGDGVDES